MTFQQVKYMALDKLLPEEDSKDDDNDNKKKNSDKNRNRKHRSSDAKKPLEQVLGQSNIKFCPSCGQKSNETDGLYWTCDTSYDDCGRDKFILGYYERLSR